MRLVGPTNLVFSLAANGVGGEGWGEVVRFSVPLRSFFWRLQSFFAAGFSFFKICVHLCPSVARFPLSAFRFSF
jgi:hypothetical protein